MQNVNRIKTACAVIDAAAILYGVLYFCWIFLASGTQQDRFLWFFGAFNPMTWGSYFLGAALVFHCFALKNIWVRSALWVLYLFSAVVSLIAIMGMYDWSDFLIYVPHLVIIPAAVIITYRRRKSV